MSVPKQEETYFPLQQKDVFVLLLQQEAGISPCPGTINPVKDCYNSANEKPLHFKFSVSYNGFCLQHPHLSTPLSSIKEYPSLLFSELMPCLLLDDPELQFFVVPE